MNSLLRLAKRDIQDARVDAISADRRFATAYNAVLQLATVLLWCRGFRPTSTGHHFTVFQAMKDILGEEHHDLADYFDSCRAKRNITDYARSGEISEEETAELVVEAEKFREVVLAWLDGNYPSLLASINSGRRPRK